jgi:hypothetical protein
MLITSKADTLPLLKLHYKHVIMYINNNAFCSGDHF